MGGHQFQMGGRALLAPRWRRPCFKLCIQPNILKSNQATKTIILTYTSKQKLYLHMQRNVEPSDIFLQPFNSVIRNFTGSSSQCFEVQTALSLSLMLSFYRTNVEPIDHRSKATWAKSFLKLLAYRKQIIQNQRKTVGRAVTINMCWRKSSCELFPLPTTRTKVANSGKIVIARYRIHYFFQKRAALPLTLLEN